MTAVAPMPIIAPGSADLGRPGQQLLPGYVVKLLKTLKIPFGTDRTMNGVDVDPSINLIGHIIDCLGALRDVNKVYRAKGSLASRSVGTRTMFGFTAELGNILLDAITFDPPNDLSDSSIYYGQVATSILNVFPEIAAQITPSTGKVLIHHTALKASATMAMESIKMVIKAFPAGAWTTDRTGALPLHWITHNQYCTSEMINYLINANPKGPWVADCDGYLPLHWAVNQDTPNIDVVASLIAANASASAKACMKGSLPLHWCVNRDVPNMQVMRALLQVHADGVRTFDKTGWLPLHQCVNRSDISLDALRLLIELYPQGLQCPNVNGQLPLHRSLDQQSPSVEALQIMLEAFPGGAKVADDEGYLPIHLALDCARPNPVIAKMLLEQYPESAFHKSKDGLLPIHCIISSMNPVVEIIQYLLIIFPDSTESMAVDVIPVDEAADPETWTGEWIEKRWTPLSRAIDRGLDAIVILFRDALNTSKSYAAAAANNNQPPLMNTTGPRNALNTATPKTLLPQNKPPLNNLNNMMANASLNQNPGTPVNQQQYPNGYNNGGSQIHHGPSTSSNEGNVNTPSRLVLGGNLDTPSHMFDPNNPNGVHGPDEEGDQFQDQEDFDAHHHQAQHQQMNGSQFGSRQLPINMSHNMSNPSMHSGMHGMSNPNMRLNPDGSLAGPMGQRPSTVGMQPGGPPPGAYGGMSLKDRGPVARGDKYTEAKHRERERQSSRDRDRGDRGEDRERRHRSSSRNHRSSSRGHDRGDRDRYYDEEDRGERRSNHRSGSRDRRSSRGDRERDDRRDSRARPPPPQQQRIYENTEYDDEDHVNQQQQQFQQQGSHKQQRSIGGPPPSTEPPKSLLDAAVNRPYSRRGPNDMSPGYPQNAGNQFNRDGSVDAGEYLDTTAVDIYESNNQGQRPLSLSIDDLV